MIPAAKCEKCVADNCDECLSLDPHGASDREGGWFPACCCGRTVLATTTARDRAAIVRSRRDAQDATPDSDVELTIVLRRGPHDSAVRGVALDVRTDGTPVVTVPDLGTVDVARVGATVAAILTQAVADTEGDQT